MTALLRKMPAATRIVGSEAEKNVDPKAISYLRLSLLEFERVWLHFLWMAVR
jgi:hypothetical protein